MADRRTRENHGRLITGQFFNCQQVAGWAGTSLCPHSGTSLAPEIWRRWSQIEYSVTARVGWRARQLEHNLAQGITPRSISKRIKELIDEQDPSEFWQIHRSTVVRVDAVAEVSRNLRGNQVVHVKGSDERLEVSRSFNHLFRQM